MEHHNHSCHSTFHQEKNNELTYMMDSFPGNQTSSQMNYQYDNYRNDTSHYNNKTNAFNFAKQSQAKDATDISNDHNNTLLHITYSERTEPKMPQPFEFNLNNRNLFTNSTSRNHSTSESLYLPINPVLQINKKKNAKMQPRTSLIKAPPCSNTPLSHLTTKKITEMKMKQLSDSINMNNDSMTMQRITTSSSIPLKTNISSILRHSPRIVPHLNLGRNTIKCEDDNESKAVQIENNSNMNLMNDKLHQFILEENAQLKQLNNKYKQMLDSAFYFINSLSYGENNQNEYDVNYYTDHISELNNALLDLEKVLKYSLEQGYQCSLVKEKEPKDKEDQIRAQIIETILKEKNELILSSLKQISEIELSIIVMPIERNVFPSFGNEIITEELISDQKEVYDNCNKNCIACLVGANNSARGYSPMKFNPNHYRNNNNASSSNKKLDQKGNNDSSRNGTQFKSRSITPRNKKMQFSN